MADDDTDSRRIQKPGCGIPCCLPFIAIAAGLFFWPLFLSPPSNSRTGCLSNVKQVSFAGLMYTSDYDDRFMPAPKWMDSLTSKPYGLSESTLKCPQVVEINPKGYGYAFNSRLSKMTLDLIPHSPNTPMFFESIKLFRSTFDGVMSLPHPGRHRDGSVFAFADGHAKWLPNSKKLDSFPK